MYRTWLINLSHGAHHLHVLNEVACIQKGSLTGEMALKCSRAKQDMLGGSGERRSEHCLPVFLIKSNVAGRRVGVGGQEEKSGIVSSLAIGTTGKTSLNHPPPI